MLYNSICTMHVANSHTHKGNIMTILKSPEVKFTKNGYEIRTDILEMAKSLVIEDFHAKFNGWEQTVGRDSHSGQIIAKTTMPEFPGLDKILETSEKMYRFVENAKSTR